MKISRKAVKHQLEVHADHIAIGAAILGALAATVGVIAFIILERGSELLSPAMTLVFIVSGNTLMLGCEGWVVFDTRKIVNGSKRPGKTP